MTITNPISKMDFFSTPTSALEIQTVAEMYMGAEQSAFYMGAALAANFSSYLVDEALRKDTPQYRAEHDNGTD